MAHTPGPWKYIAYDDDVVTDDERFSIVGHHASVLEDDARLIAAAPELLEALEEMVDLFDGLVSGEYQPDSFTTQPARAAIAKAKGEDHA